MSKRKVFFLLCIRQDTYTHTAHTRAIVTTTILLFWKKKIGFLWNIFIFIPTHYAFGTRQSPQYGASNHLTTKRHVAKAHQHRGLIIQKSHSILSVSIQTAQPIQIPVLGSIHIRGTGAGRNFRLVDKMPCCTVRFAF